MEIEFYKSKGYNLFFLPTIAFHDYWKDRFVIASFLWWHFRIGWRKRA